MKCVVKNIVYVTLLNIYKKRALELRLQKTQLQSDVWATLYTNLAPPLDV